MRLHISCTKVGSMSLATFTAVALSFAINVRVLAVEFMPYVAMGLASINCGRRIATSHVLLDRDDFKMVWVAAQAISTQVVNSQAARYRSLSKLIGKPVCIYLVAFVAICTIGVKTVSSWLNIPSPRPALAVSLRAIDLYPETNVQWNLVMFHNDMVVTSRNS